MACGYSLCISFFHSLQKSWCTNWTIKSSKIVWFSICWVWFHFISSELRTLMYFWKRWKRRQKRWFLYMPCFITLTVRWHACSYVVHTSQVVKSNTVKLHKCGPLLQTVGHPYLLLLGQPSFALLSTAQAGGPPSVEIGWATKNIIFEDVRSHKMTSFFTCHFFGQLAVVGIFSAHVY